MVFVSESGYIDGLQEYINGKKSGISILYENGVVNNIEWFFNGKKNGVSVQFGGYQKEPVERLIVYWIEHYKNDVKNGVEVYYWGNKFPQNILRETNYKNGLKEGSERFFDKNGNFERENNYKSGKYINSKLRRVWYIGSESNKIYFDAIRRIENALCVDRDARTLEELSVKRIGNGYCD